MTPDGPSLHFINVEYFFRLLYDLFFGAKVSGGTGAHLGVNFLGLLAQLWLVVIIVGSIVSICSLMILVNSTLRMLATKRETAPRYATIHDEHHAEEETEHHRWAHVLELIESPNDSDWRQAIIEADIILDDMLARLGYTGATVGDKLKQIDPSHFGTLNDAWEAHKVRNDIAHQGSAFVLTDHIAYRTVKQYENVFREHHEI